MWMGGRLGNAMTQFINSAGELFSLNPKVVSSSFPRELRLLALSLSTGREGGRGQGPLHQPSRMDLAIVLCHF